MKASRGGLDGSLVPRSPATSAALVYEGLEAANADASLIAVEGDAEHDWMRVHHDRPQSTLPADMHEMDSDRNSVISSTSAQIRPDHLTVLAPQSTFWQSSQSAATDGSILDSMGSSELALSKISLPAFRDPKDISLLQTAAPKAATSPYIKAHLMRGYTPSSSSDPTTQVSARLAHILAVTSTKLLAWITALQPTNANYPRKFLNPRRQLTNPHHDHVGPDTMEVMSAGVSSEASSEAQDRSEASVYDRARDMLHPPLNVTQPENHLGSRSGQAKQLGGFARASQHEKDARLTLRDADDTARSVVCRGSLTRGRACQGTSASSWSGNA